MTDHGRAVHAATTSIDRNGRNRASRDFWTGPPAGPLCEAPSRMDIQRSVGRTGSTETLGPSRRVVSAVLTLLIAVSVAAPGAILAATPVASLAPTPRGPVTLNLYKSAGFRYQDPNYTACTATSVMDMLNFVSLGERGGPGFRWSRSLSARKRDSILRWERAHHTMVGGKGTDMHGWRNALDYFGWGSSALQAGARVYDDFSFTSYGSAMKAAVRAMISTRKPVAMAAWAGRHAVMITGYYDLKGDPFARDGAGQYTDAFSVGGFYLSDPLKSAGRRNARISNARLQYSSDARLRFRPYRETDSPYDDQYTPGFVTSKSEWYGKWVLILPVR
jgi:hypothetical protein